MKERPILFTAAMVRALLDGSKSQTRRIYKNRKHPDAGCDMAASELVREPQHVIDRVCPYGAPGGHLWVREKFAPIYPQDPTYNNGEPIAYDYAATYKHGDRLGDHIGIRKVWKPSIHMPRGASRITLEIVSVRVERLQDISKTDALADGIKSVTKDGGRTIKYGIPDRDGMPGTDDDGWHWADWQRNPRNAYFKLWDNIHGDESGSGANPFVWVVEFHRITDEVK